MDKLQKHIYNSYQICQFEKKCDAVILHDDIIKPVTDACQNGKVSFHHFHCVTNRNMVYII